MNKELVAIFEYLEREKGIKRDVVISAIQESLQAAARKSIKGSSNVTVQINPKTGNITVYSEKEIVDEVEVPTLEISLDDARQIDPDSAVGQFIDVEITPEDFGRIAAQKARQIISRKLRSAERDVIYEEYRHRINDIVSGTVKRFIKGSTIVVDLGKVEALLPARNYPKTEFYNIGDKVLALLWEVNDTENGGAEVILTRSHPEFVKQLMMQEIPELEEGIVVIDAIVREAGYRTKLAVHSEDPKVDPVGACVGMRGMRVKNIVRELNNEKIDIIPYSSDPITLLQNALEPIDIRKIKVDEERNVITIVVEEDDFSKVIGKRGFNKKLTSQLIGKELEVQRMSDYHKMMALQHAEFGENTQQEELSKEIHSIEGINSLIVDALVEAGYVTLGDYLEAKPQELAKIPGINLDTAYTILENIRKQRI